MGNFFGRAGIWWGVLGLELILVLSPLMVTDYPPISDLPNHMARIAIIADAGHDPTLAQMYRPAWHAIPDLAADLIGPPLLNLFPLSVVARILLGLAVTLCLAGTSRRTDRLEQSFDAREIDEVRNHLQDQPASRQVREMLSNFN